MERSLLSRLSLTSMFVNLSPIAASSHSFPHNNDDNGWNKGRNNA
jgi:hypothetical protein